MIVTVTLNAAVDRTLTVPNFQPGHRHRASHGARRSPAARGSTSRVPSSGSSVPVVATGLAGGRTGARIVEELTNEAILNDFVRIADESRTSTAVVDPTAASYTRDQRVGAARRARGARASCSRSCATCRAGRTFVVFAGSLPRGVDEGFYARGDPRAEPARSVPTVLDSEGEPLRLGVEAEPFLVSPNQREAEGLVGQEFPRSRTSCSRSSRSPSTARGTC